jgi:hypothetical protein
MLRTVAKHALARAFDDKDIRVLVEALDQAWDRLRKSASALVKDGHSKAARELLALRIIELALLGERDPSRLRGDALNYLAQLMSNHIKARADSSSKGMLTYARPTKRFVAEGCRARRRDGKGPPAGAPLLGGLKVHPAPTPIPIPQREVKRASSGTFAFQRQSRCRRSIRPC